MKLILKDINIKNVNFLFKDLNLSKDKVNLISSEKFNMVLITFKT